MSSPLEVTRHRLLGVDVVDAPPDAVLDGIERAVRSGAPTNVFFANAHTLNLAAASTEFAAVLSRAAWVLNDGVGVAMALRARGVQVQHNLNGTDFMPRALERAAACGWPVYLLGGRPGVAERAGAALSSAIPGLQIVGTRDGYFDTAQTETMAREIRASGAHVLVVAMGNPLQELWLDQNLPATGCALGFGVGAFLDFSAGEVARAPEWVRSMRFEWGYRLAKEPGRMWERYVIGNPAFMLRALREQLRRWRGLA